MATVIYRSTAALAILVALACAPPAAIAEDLATPDTVSATASPQDNEKFEGRKSVEQYFRDKGLRQEVAAGIADNVQRESSFNPLAIGDGGSSGGLFQMHNERFVKMLADIQMNGAWRDLTGRDAIASAHFQELKNAGSRQEAARIFGRYFERCAACGDPIPKSSRPPKGFIAPPAIEKLPARPKNVAEQFSDRLAASSDVYHAATISFR
jgi:hypothetical protein